MKMLFQKLLDRMNDGKDTVLVTVVASSGSTPRGAGSRMLVGEEGRIYGTIGGGNVEHKSREIAQQVLVDHNSHEHAFNLNRNDVESLGMICGGDVNVYFRYIPSSDGHTKEFCEKIEAMFSNDENIWISEGDELEVFSSRPDIDGFVEHVNTPGKVYIFGCGHIGQALAPILSSVGFKVVALDDRPEFANKELFPTADVKICDFEHISDTINITENDCCCVMTRGHGFDAVVEAQILMTKAYYIGVIGSSKKAYGVGRRLVEEFGVPESELSRIVTPIGLSIKAETPAEIAISIAAQMIEKRAEHLS